MPATAFTSVSQAIAPPTLDDSMLERLLQQNQPHFQKLVLKKTGDSESAFAMFMFVRIVTEVCEALHIPCGRGVAVHVRYPVGDGTARIGIADIVEGFKDGSKVYRSPNTFGNYRTMVVNAEALLNHMESEGRDHSPREIRYLRRARQLLQTPLHEAVQLDASRYGKIKEFADEVKTLTRMRHLETSDEF
jgi:hypothetical protein